MSGRHLLPLLGAALLAACAGTHGTAAGPADPAHTAAAPPPGDVPVTAPAPARASPPAGAVPARPAGPAPDAAPGGSAAAERKDEPAEPQGGAERDRGFQEGIQAYRAGRWEQAAGAFRDVLRRHPDDADAQYDLGLTEERMGRLGQARESYEAALKLAPDHVGALGNLARLERQTGRSARAVELLQRAARRPLLASQPGLWVQLSMTERWAGQLAEAEEAARRALSLRRDPAAYEALALVASARGQDREAELLALSALRLDEARASTHVTLGLIAYRLGEVPRARAEFERASALDPTSAEAWANLGALALEWRDYAGAERAFRRASELEPWGVEARLHLAQALAAQGGEHREKAQAAAAAYREVLARAPDRPEAICGAGWALADDQGAAADAARLLRRCVGLPGTPPAERRKIEGRLATLGSGPEPASRGGAGGGATAESRGPGGGR